MKYCLYTLLLFAFFSCQKKAEIVTSEQTVQVKQMTYDYDEEALLKRVEFLASDELEGRETGTPGGELAKSYVMAEIRNLNIPSFKTGYLQTFRFKNPRGKNVNGANIFGVIKGSEFPDEYIVVSAHFDHLGFRDGKIFNGADDNASGTSGILAVGEHFLKNPPKHSIIIIALDAEEMGSPGAKEFLKYSPVPIEQFKLNVNLDMVSRNDKNELYICGTSHYPELKENITSKLSSPTLTLLHGHDGADGKHDWTGSSDHRVFHKEGIPFLYFGVEDHEDYHKASDEYQNIQPEFFKEAVNVVIQAIAIADEQSL